MSAERIPYDQPQTWYFTFGSDHAYPNSYVVIRNANGAQAREMMFDRFGRAWAFQYDQVDWFKHGESQADRYGLAEVEA